jgi:hypothetical protein
MNEPFVPRITIANIRHGPARHGEFLERDQSDSTRPAQSPKLIAFSPDPNQIHNAAIPSRGRGVGHRHERWDGMRWTRQRRARRGIAGQASVCERSTGAQTNGAASGFINASADVHMPAKPLGEDGSRTAKPCGPGTRCWCQVGGGFGQPDRVRQNLQSADDGDKTNSSPGRARYKPLKPSACGNAGCFRWTRGEYRVHFSCTRAAGASGARHSPRPPRARD